MTNTLNYSTIADFRGALRSILTEMQTVRGAEEARQLLFKINMIFEKFGAAYTFFTVDPEACEDIRAQVYLPLADESKSDLFLPDDESSRDIKILPNDASRNQTLHDNSKDLLYHGNDVNSAIYTHSGDIDTKPTKHLKAKHIYFASSGSDAMLLGCISDAANYTQGSSSYLASTDEFDSKSSSYSISDFGDQEVVARKPRSPHVRLTRDVAVRSAPKYLKVVHGKTPHVMHTDNQDPAKTNFLFNTASRETFGKGQKGELSKTADLKINYQDYHRKEQPKRSSAKYNFQINQKPTNVDIGATRYTPRLSRSKGFSGNKKIQSPEENQDQRKKKALKHNYVTGRDKFSRLKKLICLTTDPTGPQVVGIQFVLPCIQELLKKLRQCGNILLPASVHLEVIRTIRNIMQLQGPSISMLFQDQIGIILFPLVTTKRSDVCSAFIQTVEDMVRSKAVAPKIFNGLFGAILHCLQASRVEAMQSAYRCFRDLTNIVSNIVLLKSLMFHSKHSVLHYVISTLLKSFVFYRLKGSGRPFKDAVNSSDVVVKFDNSGNLWDISEEEASIIQCILVNLMESGNCVKQVAAEIAFMGFPPGRGDWVPLAVSLFKASGVSEEELSKWCSSYPYMLDQLLQEPCDQFMIDRLTRVFSAASIVQSYSWIAHHAFSTASVKSILNSINQPVGPMFEPLLAKYPEHLPLLFNFNNLWNDLTLTKDAKSSEYRLESANLDSTPGLLDMTKTCNARLSDNLASEDTAMLKFSSYSPSRKGQISFRESNLFAGSSRTSSKSEHLMTQVLESGSSSPVSHSEKKSGNHGTDKYCTRRGKNLVPMYLGQTPSKSIKSPDDNLDTRATNICSGNLEEYRYTVNILNNISSTRPEEIDVDNLKPDYFSDVPRALRFPNAVAPNQRYSMPNNSLSPLFKKLSADQVATTARRTIDNSGLTIYHTMNQDLSECHEPSKTSNARLSVRFKPNMNERQANQCALDYSNKYFKADSTRTDYTPRTSLDPISYDCAGRSLCKDAMYSELKPTSSQESAAMVSIHKYDSGKSIYSQSQAEERVKPCKSSKLYEQSTQPEQRDSQIVAQEADLDVPMDCTLLDNPAISGKSSNVTSEQALSICKHMISSPQQKISQVYRSMRPTETTLIEADNAEFNQTSPAVDKLLDYSSKTSDKNIVGEAICNVVTNQCVTVFNKAIAYLCQNLLDAKQQSFSNIKFVNFMAALPWKSWQHEGLCKWILQENSRIKQLNTLLKSVNFTSEVYKYKFQEHVINQCSTCPLAIEVVHGVIPDLSKKLLYSGNMSIPLLLKCALVSDLTVAHDIFIAVESRHLSSEVVALLLQILVRLPLEDETLEPTCSRIARYMYWSGGIAISSLPKQDAVVNIILRKIVPTLLCFSRDPTTKIKDYSGFNMLLMWCSVRCAESKTCREQMAKVITSMELNHEELPLVITPLSTILDAGWTCSDTALGHQIIDFLMGVSYQSYLNPVKEMIQKTVRWTTPKIDLAACPEWLGKFGSIESSISEALIQYCSSYSESNARILSSWILSDTTKNKFINSFLVGLKNNKNITEKYISIEPLLHHATYKTNSKLILRFPLQIVKAKVRKEKPITAVWWVPGWESSWKAPIICALQCEKQSYEIGLTSLKKLADALMPGLLDAINATNVFPGALLRSNAVSSVKWPIANSWLEIENNMSPHTTTLAKALHKSMWEIPLTEVLPFAYFAPIHEFMSAMSETLNVLFIPVIKEWVSTLAELVTNNPRSLRHLCVTGVIVCTLARAGQHTDANELVVSLLEAAHRASSIHSAMPRAAAELPEDDRVSIDYAIAQMNEDEGIRRGRLVAELATRIMQQVVEILLAHGVAIPVQKAMLEAASQEMEIRHGLTSKQPLIKLWNPLKVEKPETFSLALFTRSQFLRESAITQLCVLLKKDSSVDISLLDPVLRTFYSVGFFVTTESSLIIFASILSRFAHLINKINILTQSPIQDVEHNEEGLEDLRTLCGPYAGSQCPTSFVHVQPDSLVQVDGTVKTISIRTLQGLEFERTTDVFCTNPPLADREFVLHLKRIRLLLLSMPKNHFINDAESILKILHSSLITFQKFSLNHVPEKVSWQVSIEGLFLFSTILLVISEPAVVRIYPFMAHVLQVLHHELQENHVRVIDVAFYTVIGLMQRMSLEVWPSVLSKQSLYLHSSSRYAHVFRSSTPNDDAKVFKVAGVKLVKGRSRDYLKSSSTADSILVTALFRIPGVERVMLRGDQCTVTKDSLTPWIQCESSIELVLSQFTDTDIPLVNETEEDLAISDADKAVLLGSDSKEDQETLDMLQEIVEAYIAPNVRSDGGDVELVAYDVPANEVLVRMKGACVGCSKSAITLQHGIERIIKHYVPEIQSVRDIGDESYEA